MRLFRLALGGCRGLRTLGTGGPADATEAADRHATDDGRFDNQIVAAPDEDQMLDIVATDEQQPATLVDGDGIDDGNAILPAAYRSEPSLADIGLQDPAQEQQQSRHDGERHEVAYHRGPSRAEPVNQKILHVSYLHQTVPIRDKAIR